ncbi:chemotaxis protein CheW, partial [Pseudenhygromyxa sp. WMMC2535]|nr:chemotaxis protein CheW [Pseudenhygromyxa sp. WMMC2535]
FHEGGLVNLEISDDGAGVDPAKIRRRAAKLGWSAEALDALDERALHELLFVPGFSTRSEAGKLSGRGVGLDVVRTNIERLGGTIELHSRLGRGTTVRVKIPLTLAIVPALIVTCAGQRFAIPQVNLIEIVRVPAAARRERFATIHGAAVLRLRGHLLPMTALARALALGEGRGGPSEAELTGEGASEGEPRDATVVVLQADEQRYGLLVEAVHDTEEIVVKPLWSVLDELGCYAGATVLGDGAVALILDSVGLAARAGLLDEVLAGEQEQAQRELVEEPARRRGNATAGPQRQYLLCRSAGAERLAIPWPRSRASRRSTPRGSSAWALRRSSSTTRRSCPWSGSRGCSEESSARGRAPRRLGRSGASSIACSW